MLPPAEAFDLLRAASGRPDHAPDANPPAIRITTVTLGTSEFSTDLGRQILPAWLFSGPGFLEPVAWPALGREAFWRYGEPNSAGIFDRSAVSADGRRLLYSVPGSSGCGATYRFTVEVTETRTAVMLTTHTELVSARDPTEACIDIGVPPVPYPVELAEPLGNRVIVAEIKDMSVEPVAMPSISDVLNGAFGFRRRDWAMTSGTAAPSHPRTKAFLVKLRHDAGDRLEVRVLVEDDEF